MRTILRTGVWALRFVDRMLEVLIFDVLLAPRRRPWVLGGAAIAGALLLWSGTARSPEPGPEAAALEAKDLLYERPWLDHIPQNEHDPYQALVFDPQGVGAIIHATAYRGQWELFLFKARDKRLQILFPHDRRKAETGFSISSIKHKTFDLELRLEDPPLGPKSLFSWKKFRRGDLEQQPLRSWALERWLVPASELARSTALLAD
jgi:hypothetical protein